MADPTESPSITVKIDGHPYTLRPRELSAWQTATFEAECGLSVEGMILSITSDVGRTLTMFARFAYLCALQSGQAPKSFQEVAERITYGSTITDPETTGLDDDEDEEDEPADPEPDEPPRPVDPGEDADPLLGSGSSSSSSDGETTAPVGSLADEIGS